MANEPKENNVEKRFQTVMIGIIMLLVGWSFNTTVDNGKDLAAIKVQLDDLQSVRSTLQPIVNQLGMDNNKTRLDLDNTMRRLGDLETRKR